MFRKHLLLTALFVLPFAAYAQSSAQATPAAQQPTPAQQRQNQQMEQAALQVAQLVDQDKVGQIWDGASNVTKQIVSRDTFVQGVDTDRKTVGAPQARSLALLTYSQSDGRKLPPGLFANVAFATRFANEKQPVRELISFHLDNDHVWRVTGYSLR
ncbi:DUF4019 domain-containing protein [Dyella caseinilytica]|uniref:DUF4019 domain-containing protein n=1 Tax=Dyella caseinilytica TaxID=1849581 RepID=A0ABX7GT21_9GAMM|nr:DUF4019 domain-containing protein [Dyella caseinilytica]QRN53587.1 DUF4019 domain-containing protein [Dyella caseinilytica]GFZ87688.1 hypothetical protein GCM10011408_02900 [Dyella caseinilytica]